ncbi:Usp domain-containing protein/U-box domain-containing protein/Pkinase_Tyr domain-containing protein [Cephalotus follicularis]|uniref:RING-type E3 ubiquitin transferase n=1 Tax=Cephalotus follicularis TaxID=3775 RepID=A0A1Q3CGG2_CEPFO|nr:Usp domain-containing protein/U-box domain-containing protein/Pkinase_Tyr domain-containing protein [Cephalotus follicularis]
MGNVSVDEDIEEGREFDVEETIFVAVGENVEKSKTTLFWAVQSFLGKKICVLHVHRKPPHILALTDKKLASSKLKQHAVKAFQHLQRQKLQSLLYEYQLILAQEGVEADKVWIETDDVESGIVEIIVRHNIRWLVMGAAADKYYSKKLTELKSKKAVFVCQQAPNFCHIWFACKGCLIYTREGSNNLSETKIASPLMLLNSDIESEQLEHLRSESATHVLRSIDAEKDIDEMEGIVRRSNSQCLEHSGWPTNRLIGSLESTLSLSHEEEKAQGLATGRTNGRREQAIIDSRDLERKSFKEAVKRWKAEDDAMEAKCEVKTLESICVKEMSQRKEMVEVLARGKLEVERMKNQQDESMKGLRMVQNQKSVLESRLAESHVTVKELEEKIISAVGLLISFKEKRDKLRLEYEEAISKVNGLKKMVKVEAASFCSPQILAFSFMEINEATQDFEPSWKIGEGKYGSVYHGLLRHVHVAIKMLPSYGSQSLLDFQNEVEVLSRIRHPNLVTLIGTCPESRSLVYEYLRNGSLEDRLACKDNTPPLSWQKRMCIASEICSVLVFLHSNKPGIIHGNLKPSNVLLDANFVSKLGDLGINKLISQVEDAANCTTLFDAFNSKVTSAYMDPECPEIGKLVPESDVYSFGIILLQLLTARLIPGIVKDVKCALEKKNLIALLDSSAGDWPLWLAEKLASLALRCCGNRLNRPDLVSEIWNVVGPLRDLSLIPASSSGLKDQRRIPSHFVCPIFQEIMKDPYIAADGFTYEAEAIIGWLKSDHNTSPMTNLKLEHCNLLPNHALYQAIQEWQLQR